MKKIMFDKCISNNTVGDFQYMNEVKTLALKQIARARFDIKGDECIAKVKLKSDIIRVIFDNSTTAFELYEHTCNVISQENTLGFFRNKFHYDKTLIDAMEEYKEKYSIRGDKLKGKIWYKLYSKEPLVDDERDFYNVKWVDYEAQLKNSDIIYDPDGIYGLFATPEGHVHRFFNDKCRAHYGKDVFVLSPVEDCFYADNGKEIVGDCYRVVDRLSLEELQARMSD